PVKLGLEVDYFPGTEADLRDIVSPYPWDYLLGSVHFVDGFPVDQEPGLVEKLGPNEAWRRYFVWLRNSARSGLFDSLSHPDLDRAVDLARAAGYETVTLFDRRQRRQVPLG